MNNQNSNNNRGPARRGSKSAIKIARTRKAIKAVIAPRPKASDYRVSAPVAKGRVSVMSKPKTRNEPNGDILITHREYIADINGSVAFTAVSYSVNPGLPGSFPWLSTLARSYESYRLESLEFRFETQAATTTTGTVILALDYDASDSAPTSKTQAMSYRGSVRSPPWSDSDHKSLKEDISKRSSYYTRGGATGTNQDIKLYDTGNLYVCTQGQANANLIGELYVDYRIRLMTPQLGQAGVGEAIWGVFSGTVNSAPFGTITGVMPVVRVSTGTTTSVSSFTFSQPWEGYVTLTLTGTVLGNVNEAGSTVTVVEIMEVQDGGALNDIVILSVIALPGQILIFNIANTTISASSCYFAQADI